MQQVHIRAFPPIRTWLDGRTELDLELEEPVYVSAVLAKLAGTYPLFPDGLTVESHEALARALVVLQDGRLLGPPDVVSPGSTVELLPSLAGG